MTVCSTATCGMVIPLPPMTAEGKDCEHHEMELPFGSSTASKKIQDFNRFRSWNDYNPYEQTQVYSFTVLKLWWRFLIACGGNEIFHRRHNSLPNRPSFLCTSSCTYRMHLTLWGHHPDVVKQSVSALDGFDEFAYGAKGSSPIFFLLYKRLVMGLRDCIW